MNPFAEPLLKRAETMLNRDPAVLQNIRGLRMNLTLQCDEKNWCLLIADGNIRSVPESGRLPDAPQVFISGTAENWKRIIDGLRGGLHRAFRHRLLRFSGDPAAMLAIWKTIWRIGETLCAARKGMR